MSTPIKDGRIFSPRLGLEVVRTKNNFRLFNPNTNEFLRTLKESEEQRQAMEKQKQTAELRAKNAEAELERLKAEIEKLKAGK